ncbi:MAG: class I SAM-dependent methyltransferase [Acidobacteriota bacterium]
MTADVKEADEATAVRARYARRQSDFWRDHALNPSVLLATQERHRAIADLFVRLGWLDLAGVRLLEVGCGTGCNLLDFLRLGFRPDHLQGIELLSASVEWARRDLPGSVQITLGDATGGAAAVVPDASLDIVYQSLVFTSLLDDRFQQRLADTMWRWLRPGGGILWYDFTMNNPRNSDVRGVPLARIRELFPHGKLRVRRLTLAPPIARAVTRLHPSLYPVFNACRWLRTHVLVWIEKP